MERERKTEGIKLTDVAGVDYPEASEILVSFPDEWEYVDRLRRDETSLYVGAMPAERERPRGDRFHGLPAEVNEELDCYRLYRLFQPWPQRQLSVLWDETVASGRVVRMSDVKLQLQPVGQAQAWYGARDAVLWECYTHAEVRKESWREELAAFWRIVERNLAARRLYTLPREPAFGAGYREFLAGLGYKADERSPGWWRKTAARL